MTTPTPDVFAFIRARLDEHDQTARRAQGHGDGRWTAIDKDAGRNGYRDVEVVEAAAPDWLLADVGNGALSDRQAQAKHIAGHDPMHVLAWVAAMRAVLDGLSAGSPLSYDGCRATRVVADAVTSALAAVWRTHPDYDPAWQPTEEPTDA